MFEVDWVTWGIPTALAALSLFVGLLQLVHAQTHPTTTLRIETAITQNGSGNLVTVTVKPTDVQELEQSGAVIRGVWYRISNDHRGPIPRFVGRWQPVSGDLQLRRGDVVWFRSVTANVSDRTLRDLPLSFYEFPVLKCVWPTLYILRRRVPLPAKPASDAESIHGTHGFSLEHHNGWHFWGEARVDHLNPHDQAVLDVVFRVSPALIKSWTFRSLPHRLKAEVLSENPRPIAVVFAPQSPPKFLGPPE